MSVRIDEKIAGVLTDGTEAKVYTFDNGHMSFSALDYGAILTSIFLPAENAPGLRDDVLLGFNTLDGWTSRNIPRFGALVGRFANRIRGAAFELDGKKYHLDANNLGNCLHSGLSGYHSRLWHSGVYANERTGWYGVRFWGRSSDGDQGFPGNLDLEVYYLLNSKSELMLRYRAVTDAATPINITNHAYFNLGGHKAGSIAGHVVQIHGGAKRLEVDEALVPTGRILDVKGTAFDFSQAKPFGKDFGHKDLVATGDGYDMCCVWDNAPPAVPADPAELDAAVLPLQVTVSEPKTKRVMTLRSNQPCCQVYTSNMLKPTVGKDGFQYDKWGAFCLETARHTNAPNEPAFPSSILRPGETYDAVTVYTFS